MWVTEASYDTVALYIFSLHFNIFFFVETFNQNRRKPFSFILLAFVCVEIFLLKNYFFFVAVWECNSERSMNIYIYKKFPFHIVFNVIFGLVYYIVFWFCLIRNFFDSPSKTKRRKKKARLILKYVDRCYICYLKVFFVHCKHHRLYSNLWYKRNELNQIQHIHHNLIIF